MSVVVLYDGGASAGRAIEYAGQNGNFIQHEGCQLIVTHMWSREPNAADGHKAGEENNNNRESENMSLPLVMQSAMTVITENKYLRDTLQYKMETEMLPPLVTSAAPVPPPGGGILSPKAAPAKAKGKAPEVSTVTPEELEEQRVKEAEQLNELKKQRGLKIVQYAAQRAQHHHCSTLVLGAGNTVEGKNVLMGTVCAAALAELSRQYVLYIMKQDGLSLRPTTTKVRQMVFGVIEGEQSLASIGVATRHALSRRRAGVAADTVHVLLIATPEVSEESVTTYTESLTALLEEAGAIGGDNNNNEEQKEAEEEEKEGGEAERAVPLLPVNVCHLTASKKIAQPDLENSMSQVLRYYQQLGKTEFVVTSGDAPLVLLQALVGLLKPHCVVVPPA
ncbi:hypothetical protein AGDE_13798 [Angomonas deanei]|nr:hypothetical protein AGDE_13798 [Angomonas deanei]|eukprot:EPY21768.1 hypothetical protein AGDE_13798 [Angomonas deanei]